MSVRVLRRRRCLANDVEVAWNDRVEVRVKALSDFEKGPSGKGGTYDLFRNSSGCSE
jgi:hypothetical protein